MRLATARTAAKASSVEVFAGPVGFLRKAIEQVPSLRYAVGVGGIAAVVAIVLTGWKLEPQTAVFGGLIVLVAMFALVAFAALSKSGPRVLRPLALFLAWAFLAITVAVTGLFVSCTFFDEPKSLPCLLRGEGCLTANLGPENELPTLETDRVRVATQILEDLYAGRFQQVYQRFGASLRTSLTFAQFRATARKELTQLGAGPLRRQLAINEQQAGFLFVAFDAEFDEVATWREIVTFVKTPKGWELFRLDLQPRSWAGEGASAVVLSESDPAAVLSRIRAKPSSAAQVTSAWIPPSGWRLRVSSVLAHRGERTCDLALASDAAAVVAHNVLGGCELAVGKELMIVGKVTAATVEQIDVDQVKLQVAPS